MISISEYPELSKVHGRLVGISSTLPIEIIYASGRIPLDLNNIFITSPSRAEIARSSGFVPRTVCSWTRGILECAAGLSLPECVIVTEGDCAHTIPILEVLRASGIAATPFEYPIGRDRGKLDSEIARLAAHFGVGLAECEKVKERLDRTRALLAKIDEMTWRGMRVTGFENHLHLVTASDFASDPDRFHARVEAFIAEAGARRPESPDLRVGCAGIPPIFSNFHEFIESLGARVVFNETQRQFSLIEGTGRPLADAYHDYTYPYTFAFRAADIKKAVRERELDCLIHYVQSFCFHQIEDRMLREELDGFPVLTLEGDHPAPLNENEKLKIESFLSAVSRAKKGTARKKAGRASTSDDIASGAAGLADAECVGIDIGSRSVKVARLSEGKTDLAILDTMDFIKLYMGVDGPAGNGADENAERVLGLSERNIKKTEYYSTGYGRYKARVFDAAPFPEIQCHAAGAVHATGLRDFTLLDIGGQDMKVIEVRDGEVHGFSMNDKCAAGSGRYLENMARILKVPLEKLSECHRDPVDLSITCATFGETEVICKLMEGVSVERILAGVNYSVYARVEPMLAEHRSRTSTLVVTSGIARNGAFMRILEERAGFSKVVVPRSPQWIGAIGACVLGMNAKRGER